MSSVVVGDQESFDRGSGGPVVPDAGGEGEESLASAGENSGWGSATVLFEAEPALEGVDDGRDPLTNGQGLDHVADERSGGVEALVVGGLLGR
jgi:hypothetical protein